jgi:hypothetical protein
MPNDKKAPMKLSRKKLIVLSVMLDNEIKSLQEKINFFSTCQQSAMYGNLIADLNTELEIHTQIGDSISRALKSTYY